MSKIRTDGNNTAFPKELTDRYSYGLTKREYFAAKALQGILARHDSYPYKSREDFLKSITSISVELADQLIIELNKTN